MKKKIFINSSVLVAVAMLITFLVSALFMYQKLAENLQQQVQEKAVYLSDIVDDVGTESLESGLLSDFTGRVTLVDAAGNVVFDSYEDEDTMENHADRPEIIQAFETGSGSAARYSETLATRSFYAARLLDNGMVLRVGNTVDSVYAMLFSGVGVVLLIFFLILVAGMFFISKTTDRMLSTINQMDLEHPLDNVAYDELLPLLKRIGEQKTQLQEQMREIRSQRQEYLTITENMKDGLIVTSLYRVLSINRAALETFHITEGECVGQDIIVVHRHPILKEIVTGALEGREMERIMEIDGRNYQLLGNPVLVSGRITGAVVFVLDVTEKKKAEQMRQEFSANVSHELKTPLMSISGYAELIKNGMVRTEDIPEFAGRIYSEAARLTTLVQDIIRLSKLDDEHLQLEMEELDLYDMTMEIINILKPEADKMQVSMSFYGKRCSVQGMRQIVYEMLYNVCDNAVHYNVTGGTVKISTEVRDDGILWQAKDTGIGIPKEEQERIFERFYRVDKSHSRATGGTGLGLSIVKHGAVLHHAKITVDSQPGQGTCIGILFPKEVP